MSFQILFSNHNRSLNSSLQWEDSQAFFLSCEAPSMKEDIPYRKRFSLFLKSFQYFLQSLAVLWPMSVPRCALATLEGCETHRVTVTECKLEKLPREIYFLSWRWLWPPAVSKQNTESAKMALLFLIFFFLNELTVTEQRYKTSGQIKKIYKNKLSTAICSQIF